MPETYHVSGSRTLVALDPDKTVLSLSGSATRRISICNIVASTTTPSDNALLWRGQRFSGGSGSGGSTPTIHNVDPAGPASGGAALSGPTTEPSYTANAYVCDMAGSVRNTLYWSALREDLEIRLAVSSSAGVGMLTNHASVTPVCRTTFYFRE